MNSAMNRGTPLIIILRKIMLALAVSALSFCAAAGDDEPLNEPGGVS